MLSVAALLVQIFMKDEFMKDEFSNLYSISLVCSSDCSYLHFFFSFKDVDKNAVE